MAQAQAPVSSNRYLGQSLLLREKSQQLVALASSHATMLTGKKKSVIKAQLVPPVGQQPDVEESPCPMPQEIRF